MKYDKDMNFIESIVLPLPIGEGWGLTHNTQNPRTFYVSDGSNVIFEADVEEGFKVDKRHSVK